MLQSLKDGGPLIARIVVMILAFSGPGFVAPASAQAYVYPSKGQTADQQTRDKGECHGWAIGQSGFDPANPPNAAAPSGGAPAPQSSAVKGAARGALVGVAAGAIAGDAGKGAAIGAVSGGMIGGMRRRDQVQQQQAQQQSQQQQHQAALQQGQAAYQRAFSACMQGRGYTVQ